MNIQLEKIIIKHLKNCVAKIRKDVDLHAYRSGFSVITKDIAIFNQILSLKIDVEIGLKNYRNYGKFGGVINEFHHDDIVKRIDTSIYPLAMRRINWNKKVDYSNVQTKNLTHYFELVEGVFKNHVNLNYFRYKKVGTFQHATAQVLEILETCGISEISENAQNIIELMKTLNIRYIFCFCIIDNYDIICNFFNNKSFIQMQTSLIEKSGGFHENNMLNIFRNSNVNFRKYDKKYLHIRLSAQALSSLSGGTKHNPDHLCTIKSQDILVDSKSSNSIHNEIHKVIAYNEYAEKINSKAFIFLDDTLPTKTIHKIKKILNETPEIINRIVIFTAPSLFSLSYSEKCKEILEDILERPNFLIVCNSEEKNFRKIQNELNNNIFILIMN